MTKWLSALKSVYKITNVNMLQSEENQYIDLLRTINESGDVRMTRGVDADGARLSTKSIFGV